MSNLVVDIFCEDHAHREFVRAMVERIAGEFGFRATVRDRVAQGGHGAALTELDLYQTLLEENRLGIPDVVVVAIDANCHKFAGAVREIQEHVRPFIAGRVVMACPDPHVERWYIADPASFSSVVGVSPRPARKKCERGFYKALLAEAVRKAGFPVTLGGIEFARELVQEMNLERASKSDKALGHFVSDLRASFKAHRN